MHYYYSPVALEEIGSSLDRLFGGLEKDKSTHFARSSNSNLVLIVSSSDLFSDLDDFIDSLATVHPCRFFSVAVDPGLSDLKAEVAVRCHGLTAKRQVCSEVVRLSCPASRLAALPELIRATLIPGTETELLVWDGGIDLTLLDALAPLTEKVFFDSSELEERFGVVEKLLDLSTRLIDLQWVRFSLWRSELRAVFEPQAMRETVSRLEGINLRASIPESARRRNAQPSCSLLAAGWFVNRLALEVESASGDTYHAVTRYGRPVAIRFIEEPGGSPSRLESLELTFSGLGRVALARVGATLKTTVEIGEKRSYFQPLDEESRFETIKRYFQIGEATTSYYDALRSAIDLRSLG